MIQRRKNSRLSPEAGYLLRIAGDCFREDLDGDVPAEPGVAGAVNLAHATRAERSDDSIRADARTDVQRHGLRAFIICASAILEQGAEQIVRYAEAELAQLFLRHAPVRDWPFANRFSSVSVGRR
jgi:hypothetical protein